MRNHRSAIAAVMAMGLMSACQIFAPAAIQQAATVRLQGSVFLPAKQVVGQDGAPLVEKPGVGTVVRLYTRDGQGLNGLTDARVDGTGQFAFQQEVPEGLYLAVATDGAKTRVMAFVRLKAGTPAATVLTAASTMVANRLGRTRLKLAGLQQPEFDEIAAQARSMMLDADVPDLSPEGISGSTDAFLASHQIIKSRIENLLSRLAHEEGLSDDPTAILPVTETPQPGASTSPSAAPDPVYTPVPKPAPTTLDLSQAGTLAVLSERRTDSTPHWAEMDGGQFLWVSCPASNSIMRFDRARPDWGYSRPTTNLLRDRFVPGQLAIDETGSSPVVWVGNQRSDGTRVARYDEWGNFLGSVDVGPAPAVLGIDTDGTGRKVWIGVTGDDSGKIVVADTSGRIVSTGTVRGKPTRLIGWHHSFGSTVLDRMWIATAEALYAVPVYDARNPTMSLAAAEADLSGVPGELRAFTIAPTGRVFVVKQDTGNARAILAELNPQTLGLISPAWAPVDTTARVVGLVSDSLGRPWIVTENEAYRFTGSDVARFTNTRRMLGLFPGRDYTFWSLHEGAPQLLKRSYGD